MPPARSATAASRTRARTSAAPRAAGPRRLAGPRRRPHARVRWDRVGRVALVIVLAVVAFLYLQHAITYFGARSSYNAEQRIVRQLARSNAQLVRRQQQLSDPATVVLDARQLGMVRPGERPFSVSGLPNQ